MKAILFSAAAAGAALAVSPLLAQTTPVTPATAQPAPAGHMAMQPMTRDGVVQMVQRHFAMLDTNKDGFITQAEMDARTTAMKDRRAERKDQRGDAMFDRMDSNHDGSVTRQEFDAAHQAMAANMQHGGAGMHRMGMMHVTAMGGQMFEMADADKDGRVSLQEATNAALAHFDQADTNHDGTLTMDEMRAAHETMRGKTGR